MRKSRKSWKTEYIGEKIGEVNLKLEIFQK